MNKTDLRYWLAAMLWAGSATVYAASDAVDSALQLMEQGRYQQALETLDNHLSGSPQDAEARFTRGLSLVRLDRTEEAIDAFTELTRDYPQLPEPYNNLAVLYAQSGEYQKARDALEAALASHPSYTIAHENLGDIYAALATAAYNRALSLDPENKPVRAKADLVAQLDGLADSGAAITRQSPATTPAAAATPASLPDGAEAALRDVIGKWSAAWSARDVDGYLGSYAGDFAPEGGASRQAWADLRRVRVTKPTRIEVKFSELAFTPLGENHVRAEFRQDYASNVLTNVAQKVLELKNRDGAWQIVREYSR